MVASEQITTGNIISIVIGGFITAILLSYGWLLKRFVKDMDQRHEDNKEAIEEAKIEIDSIKLEIDHRFELVADKFDKNSEALGEVAVNLARLSGQLSMLISGSEVQDNH